MRRDQDDRGLPGSFRVLNPRVDGPPAEWNVDPFVFERRVSERRTRGEGPGRQLRVLCRKAATAPPTAAAFTAPFAAALRSSPHAKARRQDCHETHESGRDDMTRTIHRALESDVIALYDDDTSVTCSRSAGVIATPMQRYGSSECGL